jgi:chromosome segregation ATPase
MAANPSARSSCDLIVNSIRNSFLNYSLHETPYSIYLTIRKSFVKNSAALNLSSSDPSLESVCSNQDASFLLNLLRKAEKSENALKRNYEDALEESEEAHKKIKDLEALVEQFRSKSLESQLKQKEKTIELLQSEKVTNETNLEVAEKNCKTVKKKIKEKEKEVFDLKKENARVTNALELLKSDLVKVNKEKKIEDKKLRKKEKKEILNETKQGIDVECDYCDKKLESPEQLRTHKQAVHTFSSVSQTEIHETCESFVQTKSVMLVHSYVQTSDDEVFDVEIEKYLCFYCEQEITSEQQLLEHGITCNGATETPSLFSFPVRPNPILFKCAICGLVKSSEAEIVNHKMRVHATH